MTRRTGARVVRAILGAVLVLAGLLPQAVRAQQFVDVVTLSPTVTHGSGGNACYSDGRDVACGGRGVYLEDLAHIGIGKAPSLPTSGGFDVSGTVSATEINVYGINARYASFTTLSTDAGTNSSWAMPAGMVMPFNLATCPTGWTEYTAARGRLVAGVGTLGNTTYTLNATGGSATVVVAAANLPAHTHTADPAAKTTSAEGSHTHAVDPPSTTSSAAAAHTHTFDPNSANASFSSAGSHSHEVENGNGNNLSIRSSSGTVSCATCVAVQAAAYDEDYRWTGFPASNYGTTSASGDHTHWGNPAAVTSSSYGEHNHALDLTSGQFGTSSGGSSHSHSVDITSFSSGSTGSGTPMNVEMPYVALLYCQKS